MEPQHQRLSECNKHNKYQKTKQHVQRGQLVFNLNNVESPNGCVPQNHANLGRQRSTSSGRLLFGSMCNQLKNLHVAAERHDPDERELVLNEAERMLNRKAEKLKEDREHLNDCVLNYNKTATAYLEKVKKYNKAAASVKRVRAWQLAREARLDDREDNITLAQLQRQLILAE